MSDESSKENALSSSEKEKKSEEKMESIDAVESTDAVESNDEGKAKEEVKADRSEPESVETETKNITAPSEDTEATEMEVQAGETSSQQVDTIPSEKNLETDPQKSQPGEEDPSKIDKPETSVSSSSEAEMKTDCTDGQPDVGGPSVEETKDGAAEQEPMDT